MAKIFPVIRRVVEVVGGGAVDIVTQTRPAIQVKNVFTLVSGVPARAAMRLSQGPLSLVMPTRPAMTVTTSASGAVGNEAAAGVAARTISESDFQVADGEAGTKVGKLRIDLTRRSGADTVTQSGVNGRQDWTNIANAEGDDTSWAQISGDALGARGGQLNFFYPAWTGKDDLTVTTCEILYYVRQDGTTLDNGDLRLIHQFPPTAQVHDLTIKDNSNYTSNPYTVDISSEISALSDLDDLECRVRFSSTATQTFSAACARVVVNVEAEWEVTP